MAGSECRETQIESRLRSSGPFFIRNLKCIQDVRRVGRRSLSCLSWHTVPNLICRSAVFCFARDAFSMSECQD